MKNSIAWKAAELIRTMDKMPITTTVDDGNIEVRTKWDDNGKITCIAEMKFTPGLTPDHFKYFFENWYENILEVNLILNSSTLVAKD